MLFVILYVVFVALAMTVCCFLTRKSFKWWENWFFLVIPTLCGMVVQKIYDEGAIMDFFYFAGGFLLGFILAMLLYTALGSFFKEHWVLKTNLCILVICIAAGVALFVSPGGEMFELEESSSFSYDYEFSGNSGTKKEKCAWCGKYAELTGKFCDDCNKNAFGKDGWYN